MSTISQAFPTVSDTIAVGTGGGVVNPHVPIPRKPPHPHIHPAELEDLEINFAFKTNTTDFTSRLQVIEDKLAEEKGNLRPDLVLEAANVFYDADLFQHSYALVSAALSVIAALQAKATEFQMVNHIAYQAQAVEETQAKQS